MQYNNVIYLYKGVVFQNWTCKIRGYNSVISGKKEQKKEKGGAPKGSPAECLGKKCLETLHLLEKVELYLLLNRRHSFDKGF